jgi:CubicO group peptidase (beta-lactamase class C family)
MLGSFRAVSLASLMVLSCVLGQQIAAPSAWAASKNDLVVAKPETVGMSTQRLAKLTRGMQALVDDGTLAGVVTMVARHGRVVHFEAVGMRDVAANAAMRKDSIFRIYSMSKPVTGVAMMMLFEEGKWQLNDPVSKYIPEFATLQVYSGMDPSGNPILKDQVHPMTMLELLSHTAGFTYGYFSDTAVDKLQREADVLNEKITLDEMIRRVAKLPLNAQPGREWHYSISADIQGYIVQKLSGMPFEEFLEERIFKPLGMVDTGFYVPKERLSRLAKVYAYDKEGKLIPVVDESDSDVSVKPGLPSGGAGLLSTATDYMRFCQMLLNGGQLNGVRLLSPRTVELMRTNVLPSNLVTEAPGMQFGLDFGVYNDPVAAGGYYGRGTYLWGGAAGTWFWIDPINDLIVVGMIQQFAGTDTTTVAGVPDVVGLSHALTYQAIVE